MDLTQRVVSRFKLADRRDDITDELHELEELQSDIEDFVFMEETATKLMHKTQQLARKYPDLRDVSAKVNRGLSDFHHRVLDELGAALDDLDEATIRRADERDELT